MSVSVRVSVLVLVLVMALVMAQAQAQVLAQVLALVSVLVMALVMALVLVSVPAQVLVLVPVPVRVSVSAPGGNRDNHSRCVWKYPASPRTQLCLSRWSTGSRLPGRSDQTGQATADPQKAQRSWFWSRYLPKC